MQATEQEMNRFVRVVDEFMANYAKLTDPKLRSDVYASRNSALIADYEQASQQAGALKTTIEATTGAWNAAKRAYANVTDETSMIIGDAVDEIRSWFGYKPMGGLGAIQLPAAAWIAGIVSAAYLLNKTMTQIFVQVETARMLRADPTLTREQALTRATNAMKSSFFGQATVPLLIAAGLAVYLLFGRKR